MKKNQFATIILMLFGCTIWAQPYIDFASISGQQLNTHYSGSEELNTTTNYFASLLIPFKINAKSTIIARLNYEQLSTFNGKQPQAPINLYTYSATIGYQHYFSEQFSALVLLTPKASTDFKDAFNDKYDLQYGGSMLLQYKISKTLRVKAGLYYNKEPFGNFFVPLFGVDWQISNRWMLYGTFPFFNRLEYKINDRLYTGIGARIFGRSYRLNSYWNRDYVWNQENQLKYFLDFYMTKKLVSFIEIGRSIGFGPKQIVSDQSRDNVVLNNPLYRPLEQGFFIHAGVAFRLRTGL
ncbi:MAG: DUF6268 family outer membrane beta-barrel protein [Bacteroidota bacterium]|jgi:hypothetical protein